MKKNTTSNFIRGGWKQGVAFLWYWIITSCSIGIVQAWLGTTCTSPCVPGNELIMRQKQHGTSHTAVQSNLRWNCDTNIADRICNFNRHYAEVYGYWYDRTTFLQDENYTTVSSSSSSSSSKTTTNNNNNSTTTNIKVTFYDSNTGKPLFTVPGMSRSWDAFITESKTHGWLSFRDDEVNWDYVRVLPNGETVSTAGTHLGHNLPDKSGNRYCINIVSVAGNPMNNHTHTTTTTTHLPARTK